MPAPSTAPAPLIESRIWLLRGHKVLLAPDLAALYEVEPRALNQAVQRNRDRFPEDFVFQLSAEEEDALKSQSVISNAATGRGGRRHRMYAFTEQGIAMLSSVLRSKRAIEVNVAIMRTFVRLRQLLATHEDLARHVDELRRNQEQQGQQIQEVFAVIQHLLEAPEEPKRRIGFPTSKTGPEPRAVIEERGDPV